MITEPSTTELNRFSRTLTQEISNPAAKAMLYGIGLSEEDMQKPQIGIASTGYEGNTCNMPVLSPVSRFRNWSAYLHQQRPETKAKRKESNYLTTPTIRLRSRQKTKPIKTTARFSQYVAYESA